MKVLDLSDKQDNPVRQLLLKQDNKTLEELAKKSQQEIQNFLLNANENQATEIDKNNDEKFNRLKSSFPKSILDKNQDIATMLETKDFDKLLATLKDKNRLQSITDQL